MSGFEPVHTRRLVDQVLPEHDEEGYYVEMDEEDDELPRFNERYAKMEEYPSTSQSAVFIHNEPNNCYNKMKEYPSTSQSAVFIHNEPNNCYNKNIDTRYASHRYINEPVIWERRSTDAEFHAAQYRFNSTGIYTVTYRRSCFKNKKKNAHDVAIVTRNSSGDYLEFSFNRCAPDGSKYFSCLGCRKAKADLRTKDVVRTIHIHDSTILSRTDPFYGHHHGCCPFTSDEELSYGYVAPQPMHMNTAVVYDNEELVYYDEVAGEANWDNDGVLNYEIPYCEEMSITESKLYQDPVPSSSGCNLKKSAKKIIRKYRNSKKQSNRPKCHLCFRQLCNTVQLIEHLQRHVDRSKTKQLKQGTTMRECKVEQ